MWIIYYCVNGAGWFGRRYSSETVAYLQLQCHWMVPGTYEEE